MPRTLFVTKGEWSGRYMRLEDDVAAQALSDGWARENEQMTPDEEKAEKERRDQLASGEAQPEEIPESLAQFENPPEEPADETQDADGEAPTHHTRRKRRSS